MVGYRTREFPAFYSRDTGYKLETKIDVPEEIGKVYKLHLALVLPSAILVVNPVPKSCEIPSDEIQEYINRALREADKKGITGKAITPFLLQRIVDLSGGRALESNIALALNNVLLGAKIAGAIQEMRL